MRLLLFVAAILLALSLPAQFAFSGTKTLKTGNGVCVSPSYLPLASLHTVSLFAEAEACIDDTTRKLPGDRDGDGIPDSLDKCPDEKGVKQYDGCPFPDSDGDGIADNEDSCPTVAGIAKYKGCPPGDRDGDKINDDEDKCPDIPGLARFQGCPLGDTDGDGVNDDDDKCRTVPGSPNNFGCPETKESKKAAKREKKKHEEAH